MTVCQRRDLTWECAQSDHCLVHRLPSASSLLCVLACRFSARILSMPTTAAWALHFFDGTHQVCSRFTATHIGK